jgi:hypothetical protein
MKSILLISLLLATVLCQTPYKDKVDPAQIGWPTDLPFDIYSGFLDVYGNGSLLTHYVFLTSMSDNSA